MRKTLACLVAVIATAAANAAPISGFTGYYAPGNWTTTDNAGGSVNTGGAPGSIDIISGDSGVGGNTTFGITIPVDGVVSFDWSSTTADWSLFWDSFGYSVNGVFTQLTDDGLVSDSGSVSLFLNSGDVFAFQANTIDGALGSSTTTISNFSAPTPEPISLVVFGGLLAGGGWLARRRMKASA